MKKAAVKTAKTKNKTKLKTKPKQAKAKARTSKLRTKTKPPRRKPAHRKPKPVAVKRTSRRIFTAGVEKDDVEVLLGNVWSVATSIRVSEEDSLVWRSPYFYGACPARMWRPKETI